MATIYSLFPTAVSAYHVDILNEEVEFVQSLSTGSNIGNATSIERHVLDNERMKRLRGIVSEAVQEYVDMIYRPKTPVETYITQSWANYTHGGEFHHLHKHNNSLVSGALYLAAGRNYDSINFYNAKEPDFIFAFDQETPFNNSGYRINVGKGDLILFPSGLWHSVERLKTDRQDQRISIAFNSFARGTFGDAMLLTELKV